jgi:2-keto-4-pentenoate hydratase/2-oxohepta-3-ene-1,7-dioic acid hydratase in catechol pathway
MASFDPETGLAHDSFGIGTYRTGDRAFPGLVLPNGTVRDVSDLWTDTHAILDDWDRALQELERRARQPVESNVRLRDLEILPVLSHPNLFIAGANNRQHVAEMMTHNKFNQDRRQPGENDESFFKRNLAEIDRRAREGMPFVLTGLHSALAGANDDISLPLIGKQPDWELEFGVVVGRTGRYLAPELAKELIAGYVMVNDLGTVDEFKRVDTRFGFDFISKSQPGFKPCGPFMVPKHFVDRSGVTIKLRVNGQTMQDWPAADMIFSPEQILSYLTERVRLMPGDLLITGSPPGNGAKMGRFLQPGDIVESEITYLGRQRNKVVAEDSQGRSLTYGPFITEW